MATKEGGKDSYLIQPLRDRERIHLLLEAERAYAAYALAQLEPDLFAQSEWWLAAGDGSEALLMHSRGGPGNALVAFGDPHALPALLSLHPGPSQTFATFREDHLEAMQRFFLLARDQPMLRMMVTAETFAAAEPGEEETEGVVEVRRLSDGDIPEIERLYSSEGSRFYYRPRHIDEGVYFGVFSDQRLVAVAGTHAVSRANGIAVVGNVFTHPLHRNHHFAVRATGAVTADAAADVSPGRPHGRPPEHGRRSRLLASGLSRGMPAHRMRRHAQGDAGPGHPDAEAPGPLARPHPGRGAGHAGERWT